MVSKQKKHSAGTKLGGAAIATKDRISSGDNLKQKVRAPVLSSGVAMSKRLSAAASVVAQARAHVATHSNVVDLDARRLRLTRVERGVTPSTGEPYLKVRFPQPMRDDHLLDLSFLLKTPQLAEPLAEGIRLWGVPMGVNTREQLAVTLRCGLIEYLSQNHAEASLFEFDRALYTAFRKWLDTVQASSEGKLLHPRTRTVRLRAPKSILAALLFHNRWAGAARYALDEYPLNAYPGVSSKSTPRKRLPRDVLEAIDAAAQTEVRAIQQRLEEAKLLLKRGAEEIASGQPDYRKRAVILAAMATRFPNVLPSYDRMRKEAPDLFPFVNPGARSRNGENSVTRLGSYLYASARDMVPFVLLFAIEGALNADTVLSLEFTGIAEVQRFGESSIAITGPKRRASSDPNKFLDAAWVMPWIEALKTLTVRLRPLLHAADRDRVFAFAQSWGVERGAKPFQHRGGPSNDDLWKYHLKQFAAAHDLPPFTLSQIRPTQGDEIGQRHGSLVAMQALGHQSLDTTDASYLGSGTRDREGEHLSSVVQQMERWVASEGRIDTRRTRLTPRMDQGAATPGFSCIDPYDSPRVGQQKNRLCRAYGECPSCPLSGADVDDPMAVALYVSLRAAIYSGQERMAPQAWLNHWAPILLDVNALVGRASASALASATRFHVRLPPVG